MISRESTIGPKQTITLCIQITITSPLVEGKLFSLTSLARHLTSLLLNVSDGRVGLWIHHDLMHGHTETCPTFDNEPLAAQPDFECLGIEIWGFDF